MSDDVKKVGVYSVLVGGTAKKFWPLKPFSDVDMVMPSAHVAPSAQGSSPTPSTLVAPPVFAIFDIVIIMSQDNVHQETIPDTDASGKFVSSISGTPSESSMPLVQESDEKVHICFAVPPNKGDLTSNKAAAGFFEGTLHLEAKFDPGGHTVQLELPLKAAKLTTEDNMFIFFVVHRKPPKNYCWTKIRAVHAAHPSKVVDSKEFRLKVMRDNMPHAFTSVNRRVQLSTNSDGFLSCQILPIFTLFTEGRPVLGLPIDWPIIINSDEDNTFFSSHTYIPRGHMIKLKAADSHNNLEAIELHSIRITEYADVNISSKQILLDAGHGVVYAYTSNRRSQEWYVAHLILDRIAQTLTQQFHIPPQNIHRTRTAGFGLIRPSDIHVEAAPENGDTRYTFDLQGQRVRAALAAVSLRELSDLLLVRHNPNGTAQAVPDADRSRFLSINADAVNAIILRINQQHLAQQQRVQMNADGSSTVRWEPHSGPHGDFVFTLERIHPHPGQDLVVDNASPLHITTADWFHVDDAMMRVLAERSARWSIFKEIGGGPAADPGTGRPKFSDNARDIMDHHGAFDYMVEKILYYLGPVTTLSAAAAAGDKKITIPIAVDPGSILALDSDPNAEDVTVSKLSDSAPFVLDLSAALTHPHAVGVRVKVKPPPAYLANGTKAWHIQPRLDFMNNLQGTCDLFITLHENASLGAFGGECLVTNNGTPPNDQIRQAKIFLKYLDGFDQGLREGGISKNIAGMLGAGNHVREKYTYFELEFMDSLNVNNSSQYRYQQMVEDGFVERITFQIVCGIVELLTDVQPNGDMDVVKYNGEWSLW